SGRYISGGHLGVAHAPFMIGHGTDNFSNPAFQVTALDPPQGVSVEQFQGRRQLRDAVDGRAPREPSATGPGRLQAFQERAFDLVTGPAARRAFDLSRERV